MLLQSSTRSLLMASTLAACVLASSAARADDVAQAKAHFAIAAEAFEQNQFRVAIDGFEEAHRLAPRASLLFSIAQAYRRQYYIERVSSDLTQAIAYYRRYLKSEPDGKRAGEASAALADLEPAAARLGLDSATAAPPKETVRPARLFLPRSVKGARATIDGGAPVTLPNRIDVTPGNHVVVIEADGYQTQRRDVPVEAGESFAIELRMIEKPALLRLNIDEGARVYVDGVVTATTPLPKPMEIAPGPRALAFARAGRVPVALQLDLRAGEVRPVDVRFELSSQRKGSYAVFALAVAAAAGGGVLAGFAIYEDNIAINIQNKLEGDDGTAPKNIFPPDRAEQQRALEARDVYRGLAFGSFGLGGGLGALGALLFVLDQREPDPPPLRPERRIPELEESDPIVEVSPVVSSEQAGMTATVRF